ncbi:MAG: alkaline phosphatase family protein [Thaumarchaeota archaeon]|nr:alkaline phosphatase family protein [Nitrososphaerota archaeon]MCL5318585.1 alkaline phosphatase family protein [Nitrososphaerota archaeon]
MPDGTFFVLGIDAATFGIICPNLRRLKNFEKLLRIGKSKELILEEIPISPSVWCGMFSGKLPEEHNHKSYVVNGKIRVREDINVEFVWDILTKQGRDIRAINVPFVVPPYSFKSDFTPIGFGLPTTEKEWEEELEKVTKYAKELLVEKPDALIVVYTLLDRIQHFHWGDKCVVDWYQKLDEKLGELLFDTGFLSNDQNHLIIISDHGFCSFGEAKVKTLPEETGYGKLKGDHSERAMLITVNVTHNINRPQDVFFAVKNGINNLS